MYVFASSCHGCGSTIGLRSPGLSSDRDFPRHGLCRLGFLPLRIFRQIRIEEAEHVRAFDDADAFLFLKIDNRFAELFHFRPMHFRPEMVFGVVAVVEEEPVVDLAVAAHAPRDRFVRVRAVMAEVTVQITEAMPEIPKRQEIENDVTPVEQKENEERDGERDELERAPE